MGRPAAAGEATATENSETIASTLGSETSPQADTSTESGSVVPDPDPDPDPTGADWSLEQDVAGVGECDPLDQDCPPGDKCVPYAGLDDHWYTTRCVPVLGDDGPGEACTRNDSESGTDSCDGSSLCWQLELVEGELHGECRSFCEGEGKAPTCDADQTCLVANFEVFNLCLDACDPLLQDCAPDEACTRTSEGQFACVHNTAPTQQGEECIVLTDCGPGLACIRDDVLPDSAWDPQCTAYCDLAAPECAMGYACEAYFGEGLAPEGLEDLGLCVAPGSCPEGCEDFLMRDFVEVCPSC